MVALLHSLAVVCGGLFAGSVPYASTTANPVLARWGRLHGLRTACRVAPFIALACG